MDTSESRQGNANEVPDQTPLVHLEDDEIENVTMETYDLDNEGNPVGDPIRVDRQQVSGNGNVNQPRVVLVRTETSGAQSEGQQSSSSRSRRESDTGSHRRTRSKDKRKSSEKRTPSKDRGSSSSSNVTPRSSASSSSQSPGDGVFKTPKLPKSSPSKWKNMVTYESCLMILMCIRCYYVI